MLGDVLAGQHHAGHEADPVVAVLADVSVWPCGAEDHLLVGDHAAHAHGVDADPGRADPAARPRVRPRAAVGSGAHSDEAAAIRCAVATAVPDGASILASWCSSMISAVSKNGAAISAKRIISTALIAKLAAMTQLLPVNSRAEVGEVGVAEARRADDRVHAVHRQPRQRHACRGGDGEVDDDLAAGVGERLAARRRS